MNTLNHLNLSTSDVAALSNFFEHVFAFRMVAQRGGGNFTVMTSEDGFVLTLMKDKNLDENAYPQSFHVGFLQRDRNAVLDIHARILAMGISAPPPGLMRGNTFGFYAQAPGGILVDVSSHV